MAGLSDFAASIDKTFSRINKNMIYDPKKSIDKVSTGIFKIDAMLNGGFAKGRLHEIYAFESAGKTSLALSVVHQILHQKKSLFNDYTPKGTVVYIDAEQTFNAEYARKTFDIYPDNEHFMVLRPLSGEQVGVILDQLVSVKNVDAVIIDSLDACRPMEEIRKNYDKESAKVGSSAQIASQIVRKALLLASVQNSAVIFINQLRAKISSGQKVDLSGGDAFGNSQSQFVTPGGYALRFYASTRLNLNYGGQIVDEFSLNSLTGAQEKAKIGNKIRITTIKNKLGRRLQQTEVSFLFPDDNYKGDPAKQPDGGWSNSMDLLELCKQRGFIKQTTRDMTYSGTNIKDWKRTGARMESEKEWMSDPKIIADAELSFYNLLKEDSNLFIKKADIKEFQGELEDADSFDYDKVDKARAEGNLEDLLEKEDPGIPTQEIDI